MILTENMKLTLIFFSTLPFENDSVLFVLVLQHVESGNLLTQAWRKMHCEGYI